MMNVPPLSNNQNEATTSVLTTSNLSSYVNSADHKVSKKAKFIGKSTLGNSHLFPQQQQHSQHLIHQATSIDAPSSFEQTDYAIKSEIMRSISNLTSCCSKGKHRFGGCLSLVFGSLSDEKDFDTSNSSTSVYSAAIRYVKKCRELGIVSTTLANKTIGSRDSFIQEIFRQCIVNEETREDGRKKFEMQYEIPNPENKLGSSNRVVVCVRTLQCVYGFTSHEWRICGDNLKGSDSGRVASIRHKRWGDDYIPDLTFAEVDGVFRRNLKDCVLPSKFDDFVLHGRHYFLLMILFVFNTNTTTVDEEQVRAAITPLSATQRTAVQWLKDYFEVHSDNSPESDQSFIPVMLKNDVYQLYVRQMKSTSTNSEERKWVSSSRFSEIWNVLFPKCKRRTYCDIPGKCDICYEIDRLRRQEHDNHTAQMLKEAHLLHRGGMFHLEREK
jgi:hypothetical protein